MTQGFNTLWDRYSTAAGRVGDAIAVVDEDGRSLTHGELVDRAERAAHGLEAHGLSAGDRIGVFLPNRIEWAVVALAAARAGIGILGLNTRFRRVELDHLLGVAEVDTVVTIDSFLGVDGPALLAELDRPVRPIIVGDQSVDADDGALRWVDIVGAADGPGEPGTASGDPGAPLIGFTTSGTTGFPKIAMHDHRQTTAHLGAVADGFGLDRDTVALVPLPMCGAFGYTAAMATLLAGGTVVLQATWDPGRAAAAIAAHGVTFFSAADNMLIDVLQHDRFEPETTWRSGGYADFTNDGSRAVALAEQVTGGRTRLSGLYGSSEGFALMSCWSNDGDTEHRARNGGRLVGPSMAVRVVDPETGSEVAPGESGELWFRGPNLIDGYLNNAEATAKAFTDDGWYRSGDLGLVAPDGPDSFVFLARLGDSLRLRGFLCDPAEIEHHLERHRSVETAQVVGVQRPGVGDVPVAFVLPTAGGAEDDERGDGAEDRERLASALHEHCRDGLANYKRPELIVVVDEFPVTDGPNGIKIRKVDLRDRAAGMLDDADGPAVGAAD